MAKAAKVTIVEAENIVETGEIDPNDVHLPGIFVDRIVPATADKVVEIRRMRSAGDEGTAGQPVAKDAAQERRNRIGRRAAEELREGYYVNLGVGMSTWLLARRAVHVLTAGVGIPTLAVSFLPEDRQVWIQSENGILGMGPYPTEDEIDAYVYDLRLCRLED